MTAEEILVVDFEPVDADPPWQVTASLPPRVVVLRAGADSLQAIARTSRLAMVRRGDDRVEVVGDERVLEELDEAARLFVEAWWSQAPAKPDRPGDGLSWDAPGFEPPDLPPRPGGT